MAQAANPATPLPATNDDTRSKTLFNSFRPPHFPKVRGGKELPNATDWKWYTKRLVPYALLLSPRVSIAIGDVVEGQGLPLVLKDGSYDGFNDLDNLINLRIAKGVLEDITSKQKIYLESANLFDGLAILQIFQEHIF